MLQITIPGREQWDDLKQEFVYSKEQTLQLEHSLVSLSKWESKWNKPFLTNRAKTREETIDYVRCMTITQNVKPEVYYNLTQKNLEEVFKYIDAPMTATTFSGNGSKKTNREVTTSELIYYWMVALEIPFECQKWHLNRLITLIRVCNEKNQPPKKRNVQETLNQYVAINAANKKKFNTKG